jgi:hypothetical protein
MSTFFAALIALAALWLVWRFVGALFRPHQPAEPVDDPFALVTAPRKRGPKGRTGAVALEEPDDDGPVDCFPPRML